MSAVFLSWLYFTQSMVTNVNKSNDEPQQTLATVSTGNWAGKKVGTKEKHQAWYVGSVGGIYCMDGNEGKQFIVWD